MVRVSIVGQHTLYITAMSFDCCKNLWTMCNERNIFFLFLLRGEFVGNRASQNLLEDGLPDMNVYRSRISKKRAKTMAYIIV